MVSGDWVQHLMLWMCSDTRQFSGTPKERNHDFSVISIPVFLTYPVLGYTAFVSLWSVQKYEGQGWNCVKRRETFLLFMFKHGTPKCMNSNSFQSTGNIKLHVILLFFKKKKTKKMVERLTQLIETIKLVQK